MKNNRLTKTRLLREMKGLLGKSELRAAKQDTRYRSLLDAIPDMIFRFSKEGTFLDFVPAKDFPPLLPPKEFLGKKIAQVLPPVVARKGLKAIKDALRTRELQQFGYQLFKNGERRDYEARFVASGRAEAIAIIKHAMHILFQSKLRFEQAVARAEQECRDSPEVERLLRFLRESRNNRGFVR